VPHHASAGAGMMGHTFWGSGKAVEKNI